MINGLSLEGELVRMTKLQESAARSDTRQYPSVNRADFAIEFTPSAPINCMVPGVVHRNGYGCNEACNLARNEYDTRILAARHDANRVIERVAKAEVPIQVYTGDTYELVTVWRIEGDQVVCFPVVGNDWLHLDRDVVLAGIAEARNAAVSR